MGCPECFRLLERFALALAENAVLHNPKLAQHIDPTRLEREISNSSAKIRAIREELLEHEATHHSV